MKIYEIKFSLDEDQGGICVAHFVKKHDLLLHTHTRYLRFNGGEDIFLWGLLSGEWSHF